ncbi:MAG: hypothetical protein IJ435_05015 [Clostridia bacterium]|nr:hypothetical protein [Clostridia bacterium]
MDENICTWLNSQPAWVRKASELFIKNGIITAEEIEELADICVLEVKGEDCSNIVLENSNILDMRQGKPFSITSISKIEGVNAISTDKALNFNPNGMAVVYGGNGTGKSGYIRILKMVSGAIYRENIRGNIYNAEKKAPKCEIEILSEDEKKILSCDLTKAAQHEIFRKIDIFDTKTAQGYIGDEKEATFEPWIFELFRILGNTATLIKETLMRRKNNAQLKELDIPDFLIDDEDIKRISKITHMSKIEEFMCEFTDDDKSELDSLRNKTQIEKNELAIKVRDRDIENLKEVFEYYQTFEKFYSETNLEKIAHYKSDWMEKKEKLRLTKQLLEATSDEIDHLGIENHVWEEFWKIARRVFEKTKRDGDADFTDVGGICPLCHQPISKNASKRMTTIDDYVNGEVAKAEYEAKEKYLKAFNYPTSKDNQEILRRISGFDNELGNLLKVNDVLAANGKLIREIKENAVEIEVVDIRKALKQIADVIKRLKDEKEALIQANTTNEQTAIQSKIIKLEAKQFISMHLEQIRHNISVMGNMYTLDEAVRLTSTNRITAKSKELAKILITDAYVERFNNELKKLSGSGLTAQLVQCRGNKGKIPYKIQLCDAEGNPVSPKDILSEGESRAVALAAFFAESGGRDERSPLIVDDPISSLDYEYEKRVILRLAEAAECRQVVVFTHRISFVVGMSEQCTTIGKVKFQEISLNAIRDRKGIPGKANIKAGRVVNNLNALLNENVSKLKKMDELSEGFDTERHYVCQQFRNCVEKSVEELLIGEVVLRFRKDVQTKRIRCLKTITNEDCEIVDEMMTKYSAYDHSMSDETPLIDFSVEEIEKDITAFLVWAESRKSMLNK